MNQVAREKPSSVSPAESHSASLPRVVDALSIAEALKTDPDALREHTSWMAVSTSQSTYPDSRILKCARWANANTKSFTLIISDYVQLHNWAAEHDDPETESVLRFTTNPAVPGVSWESFFHGKHVRELNRSARRRKEQVEKLFHEHEVDAEVLLWTEAHDKIKTESQETDMESVWFFNQEWDQLIDTVRRNPLLDLIVQSIHWRRAPELRNRLIAGGQPADFVDETMQGYTLEEIFMTIMQAKTGWGTIKLGPPTEHPYDVISAKYLKDVHASNEPSTPFGAVHLDV